MTSSSKLAAAKVADKMAADRTLAGQSAAAKAATLTTTAAKAAVKSHLHQAKPSEKPLPESWPAW